MKTSGHQDPRHQPRLRLTEARILRDLSQQEVADRIGTTSVNISRWERGITKPGPYFRRKLCQLFGKTEQELDLELAPETSTSTSNSTVASVPVSAAPPLVTDPATYDPMIPLEPELHLVGRNEELTRLKERLRTGRNVALTALNGLPGVGKTAISIALAYDPEIRAHFHDGILWAGLGPSPNIASQLSRWGTLLGMSASQVEALGSNKEWAQALRMTIGSRSLLLVIDDAWKTSDALALKVGGPNCTHLVTTRFPNIASSITTRGIVAIQELNEDESMNLLKMLAPTVVQHEARKVQELVQAVGGLPLALTLMGNYLRNEAQGQNLRRVTAALERLSNVEERLQIGQIQELVEGHTSLSGDASISLQSIISVTDQQLDEEARAALYALSVFPPKPNNFSEEAALAATASSAETIDILANTGLLEHFSAGRYTLHQTIADYARVHLKENPPEEHAAYERFIAYALAYTEAHRKDYELLEVESDLVLAALDAADKLEMLAELVRGVGALKPFLLARGLYPLAEKRLQRAHHAAVVLQDQRAIASMLLYLGDTAQKQGHYEHAIIRFREGLALARKIGYHERIIGLLRGLGEVYWKRGEYAQAEMYLLEGLSLARQTEDYGRMTVLLKTLGSVAASQGDYARSEVYLQEGLTFARQVGDLEQICALLINLGATVAEQGKYTQAEKNYQEALLLARQIGHREWICALLGNLGYIASEQGSYSQAQVYIKEGLLLARHIGNREWVSILLINLGLITQKQEHYSQAQEYFQESLILARQIGRPRITSNVLYEYGNFYLNQQQINAARESFQEMLTINPEEDQEVLALARYGLARVASAQGDSSEARRLGEASATALEGMGHYKAIEVRHWLEHIID